MRLLRHALLLALAAPALSAQGAGHSHAPAPAAAPAQLDGELAEHFKGITLTEVQVRQVMEIKKKRHEAMDRIRKDAPDPDAAAVKDALQREMDGEHAEFLALLDPAQRRRFMENLKSHHAADSTRRPMEHGMRHDGSHDMHKAPTKVPEVRRP